MQSFRKALGQLSQGVALARQRALSELEEQGLIQAFEFTHELAWKTFKDFLEARGATDLYGSRDATRQAFSAGLIEEGVVWMEMIQSRNQALHTYDKETASEIAEAIQLHYLGCFEAMEQRFSKLEQECP